MVSCGLKRVRVHQYRRRSYFDASSCFQVLVMKFSPEPLYCASPHLTDVTSGTEREDCDADPSGRVRTHVISLISSTYRLLSGGPREPEARALAGAPASYSPFQL